MLLLALTLLQNPIFGMAYGASLRHEFATWLSAAGPAVVSPSIARPTIAGHNVARLTDPGGSQS